MAEILKADAGILDSDAPATILDKARTDRPAVHGRRASGTSEVLMSAIGIEVGSDPLAGVEPAAAGRRHRGRLATLLRVALCERGRWSR